MLSVFMVNTETHQPSPLPDSPPPGFPDWPPAEQPRPGAVPAGPGSQPAGPSSVGRLRSATGQLLSTALPVSHSNVPTRFRCRAVNSSLSIGHISSLFQACYVRGINSYSLSSSQCREWLSRWLQVSSSLKGNFFFRQYSMIQPLCLILSTKIADGMIE